MQEARDADLRRVIPMGIHGDDAQAYKTSANYKVIVMQWNSVLSEQQSFLSRFLLSMFAYNRIVPGKTME